MRPIFRDRFDLEAGHSLREQVVAARRASEALIVICSPHSAKSTYVNEEIRQFKALGRGTRIFPIIVDGVPGDPQNDCFPLSLCRHVAPDGSLTDETDEPIAADARDEGDGKDLAALKLIAGLIGIDLDEIRKREAIELRRRQRRSAIIAGLMTVFKGLFVMKNNTDDDRRDKIKWKYDSSAGPRNLGDPITTTTYTVCIYAGDQPVAVTSRRDR